MQQYVDDAVHLIRLALDHLDRFQCVRITVPQRLFPGDLALRSYDRDRCPQLMRYI